MDDTRARAVSGHIDHADTNIETALFIADFPLATLCSVIEPIARDTGTSRRTA
ncbi:hypothetical protein [Burkholderia sp. WAC0059]|uniref:hypothetical protein n=1 Tax=Burkholderia sp. WAC0059 TaxID=2066022 RepID=UPI0015E0B70F|nr:hypothetical protein [Burkholderia sp. WAC0059]